MASFIILCMISALILSSTAATSSSSSSSPQLITPHARISKLFQQNILNTQEKDRKKKISTATVSGLFPTNPSYLSFALYSDATCTIPSGAATTVLNTCLSDGIVSYMYTCGKKEIFQPA